MATDADLVQVIDFSDFYQSAPVHDDYKIGVFERNGDDIVAFDLKTVIFASKGYLPEDKLGVGDVGDAVVRGVVEEVGLFEAFEGGLADNLHAYFIPRRYYYKPPVQTNLCTLCSLLSYYFSSLLQ